MPGVNADPALQDHLVGVRRALRRIDLGPADTVVILSSHGSSTGIYRSVSGTLEGFGLDGFEVRRATDDRLVKTLAHEWEVPILEGPVDHGVTVPLLLCSFPDAPVVAATIHEWNDRPEDSLRAALRDAHAFAAALTTVAADDAVTLVASAHTSAALSPRAPLTFREEGLKLHHAVCEAVRFGWTLDEVPLDLWREAGTCGAGPLVAFAKTMRGREGQLMAFDRSVGVGYVVATVR